MDAFSLWALKGLIGFLHLPFFLTVRNIAWAFASLVSITTFGTLTWVSDGRYPKNVTVYDRINIYHFGVYNGMCTPPF